MCSNSVVIFCTSFQLQSALREFDFLNTEDRQNLPEYSNRTPPTLPHVNVMGKNPMAAQEQWVVPPSPQPVVEFPDDEVLITSFLPY